MSSTNRARVEELRSVLRAIPHDVLTATSPLQQENEKLRARVAELDEANARLREKNHA